MKCNQIRHVMLNVEKLEFEIKSVRRYTNMVVSVFKKQVTYNYFLYNCLSLAQQMYSNVLNLLLGILTHALPRPVRQHI